MKNCVFLFLKKKDREYKPVNSVYVGEELKKLNQLK